MTTPLQPASTRDQALFLLLMVLVLGVCVGATALVTELVRDDSSCAGRVMMGGQPYVCIERDDALHCYRKECDQ